MNYIQLKNEEILKLIPTPLKQVKTGGFIPALQLAPIVADAFTSYTDKKTRDKLVVVGDGVLDKMIDSLPFEMHMPGYQYLGPGTNLELRTEKGVQPKNKLDALAMAHDQSYAKSKNLKDRHAADYALQEGAWNRVLAKDAGFGEKAVAWLTTNAMKAKRSVGGGLLTKHPVSLNATQQAKLAVAVEKLKPITLTLTSGRTKDSVMSETFLPLTASQMKNIKLGKRRIRLSVNQLKKIKSGGFLPALLAAAPAIAGVVGSIASVANAYNNKKANDKLVAEKIRHNKAMEGKGVYINKKPPAGKGVYINKKPATGNGLLEELLKKKGHSVE